MSEVACQYCRETLKKDIIGLNKKLLGRSAKKFMCLVCLADFLNCTIDDLLVKIQEFKEQGCGLFR